MFTCKQGGEVETTAETTLSQNLQVEGTKSNCAESTWIVQGVLRIVSFTCRIVTIESDMDTEPNRSTWFTTALMSALDTAEFLKAALDTPASCSEKESYTVDDDTTEAAKGHHR